MVLDSQPARTSLTDNLVLSIFFLLSFQFSTWHPALCHLTSRDEETYRLKLGEEIEKSQFSRRTKSKCRDKSFERISREGLVRKYWGWIFLRKTCGRRKKKCRKKLETQVRVYLGHGFSPGVGFEEGWRYKLTERKLRACVCVRGGGPILYGCIAAACFGLGLIRYGGIMQLRELHQTQLRSSRDKKAK